MVLVPESGAIAYKRAKNHVSVAVDQETIHRVHPLRVDPTLGRLLDNGELGCKLFLAYVICITLPRLHLIIAGNLQLPRRL